MRTVSLASLITVALMTGLNGNLPWLPQSTPVAIESRLDPRIPAPQAAQYRAILDPRDWVNPYLDVAHDGYRLRSLWLPGGTFVAPKDLRRALIELPISDWPHGRVAVVQLPSIVRVEEIGMGQRNFDTALELLKALDADWWGWPP